MLDVLAERFPATKFLRIISTQCIPQYPDRNLPTVLVYKDTKCVETLMGLLPYGGRRLTPERESIPPLLSASYINVCPCMIPLYRVHS